MSPPYPLPIIAASQEGHATHGLALPVAAAVTAENSRFPGLALPGSWQPSSDGSAALSGRATSGLVLPVTAAVTPANTQFTGIALPGCSQSSSVGAPTFSTTSGASDATALSSLHRQAIPRSHATTRVEPTLLQQTLVGQGSQIAPPPQRQKGKGRAKAPPKPRAHKNKSPLSVELTQEDHLVASSSRKRSNDRDDGETPAPAAKRARSSTGPSPPAPDSPALASSRPQIMTPFNHPHVLFQYEGPGKVWRRLNTDKWVPGVKLPRLEHVERNMVIAIANQEYRNHFEYTTRMIHGLELTALVHHATRAKCIIPGNWFYEPFYGRPWLVMLYPRTTVAKQSGPSAASQSNVNSQAGSASSNGSPSPISQPQRTAGSGAVASPQLDLSPADYLFNDQEVLRKMFDWQMNATFRTGAQSRALWEQKFGPFGVHPGQEASGIPYLNNQHGLTASHQTGAGFYTPFFQSVHPYAQMAQTSAADPYPQMNAGMGPQPAYPGVQQEAAAGTASYGMNAGPSTGPAGFFADADVEMPALRMPENAYTAAGHINQSSDDQLFAEYGMPPLPTSTYAASGFVYSQGPQEAAAFVGQHEEWTEQPLPFMNWDAGELAPAVSATPVLHPSTPTYQQEYAIANVAEQQQPDPTAYGDATGTPRVLDSQSIYGEASQSASAYGFADSMLYGQWQQDGAAYDNAVDGAGVSVDGGAFPAASSNGVMEANPSGQWQQEQESAAHFHDGAGTTHMLAASADDGAGLEQALAAIEDARARAGLIEAGQEQRELFDDAIDNAGFAAARGSSSGFADGFPQWPQEDFNSFALGDSNPNALDDLSRDGNDGHDWAQKYNFSAVFSMI